MTEQKIKKLKDRIGKELRKSISLIHTEEKFLVKIKAVAAAKILRRACDDWRKLNVKLRIHELMTVVEQIAASMKFLAEACIHDPSIPSHTITETPAASGPCGAQCAAGRE